MGQQDLVTVFQDMGVVCMVEEVEKEPVERVVFKKKVGCETKIGFKK